MKQPSRFLLAACAAIAATATALSTGRDAQAQEGKLYWADDISMCEDPCPKLVYFNCRCVKMDPIIIIAN